MVILGVIGIIGFYIAYLMGITALNAWAITKLWLWFAVPFGLVPISMGWAYGILLLIGLFSNESVDASDKTKGKSLGQIVWLLFCYILRPLLAVGFGYFVHTHYM